MINNKPHSWSAIAHGASFQKEINAVLSEMLSGLFGYYLLKLGPLASQLDTSTSPITQHFSISEFEPADAIAQNIHLPINKNSIDCVVTSMLLEFEANPFRVLREINKTVIAGGHLIIIGCNPLSLLSLGKCLPHKKHELPWSGHFFSAHRVKDWLEVLGYQIIEDRRAVYHPLIIQYCEDRFWQAKMQSWLPQLGSFYLINAKKVETPLTPSRIWKRKRNPSWAPAPTPSGVSNKSDL